MKTSILLAMVATARQSSILHEREVYRFTDKGQKIKRKVSIFKTALLIGIILIFSFGAGDTLSSNLFMTILLVLIAYIVVIGLSYLFGMFLLRNENDINSLVTKV